MTAESVVTRMRLPAPPLRIWSGLLFFEQVAEPPPLPLRLLLPAPIRAEGPTGAVGDEARCVYAQGYLIKRVTRIDPPRGYGFEVVEQRLELGGGMRLRGGRYELRPLPDGSTEVALETRYASPRGPRWLWRPLEAAVCHAFHRHLLGAIRRGLDPEGPRRPLAA